MTSASPVGVGITLNSELFVQSDRVAAFVITGGQRYLLFSLVGVTFPFLIVSTKKHHRSPAITIASAQMFEFQHAKLLLILGSVSSRVPESPGLVLLPAVHLRLRGRVSLHLLHPPGDQREDHGGDLQ